MRNENAGKPFELQPQLLEAAGATDGKVADSKHHNAQSLHPKFAPQYGLAGLRPQGTPMFSQIEMQPSEKCMPTLKREDDLRDDDIDHDQMQQSIDIFQQKSDELVKDSLFGLGSSPGVP